MSDIDTDVFQLITSYKLSSKADDRAYNGLLTTAKTYKENTTSTPTKEGFNVWLHDGEVQYMETYHPTEKTSQGKWKFSNLPAAYRSAKSVIGAAIENGVELDGKGKTQLEKEIKKQKTVVDPFAACVRAIKTLDKNWGELEEVQQQYLRDEFNSNML